MSGLEGRFQTIYASLRDISSSVEIMPEVREDGNY